MNEVVVDTRRTNLMFLPNVAIRVREALAAAGLPEEDWDEACAAHVAGRCTMCEETLGGEDFARWLLALGTDAATGKRPLCFIRLERGCCGNPGCNATFYEFTLTPHPAIDWGSVSFGALDVAEDGESESTVKLAAEAGRDVLVKQFTRRTMTAVVVFLSLWIFSRWYNGESIPLVRVEKSFTGQPLTDLEAE